MGSLRRAGRLDPPVSLCRRLRTVSCCVREQRVDTYKYSWRKGKCNTTVIAMCLDLSIQGRASTPCSSPLLRSMTLQKCLHPRPKAFQFPHYSRLCRCLRLAFHFRTTLRASLATELMKRGSSWVSLKATYRAHQLVIRSCTPCRRHDGCGVLACTHIRSIFIKDVESRSCGGWERR